MMRAKKIPSMKKIVATIGALACFGIVAANSHAITLDWDTVTWTNGSLTGSYDIDPAKAGNDITVTASGDTAQFGTESTGQLTPATTTNLQGGLVTAEKTLTLLMDFSNQTQAITVNFGFSALYTQGVTNVSFTIFDVDFASFPGNSGTNFQDQIRSIYAIAADGVTLVAPTIAVGSAVSLTGTGLNQFATGIATSADNGVGSQNGNVTISFGPAAISSLTFVYGSGAGTNANPTAQHVGIYDLSFKPVPEINPAWFGGLSCIAAGFLVLRHNARVRK